MPPTDLVADATAGAAATKKNSALYVGELLGHEPVADSKDVRDAHVARALIDLAPTERSQ